MKMNQILAFPLWFGHARHGRDFRQVFETGIKAILYLAAEEELPQPPRDLISCHFPLLDGTGNDPHAVLLAVNTTATLLRLHVPTLLCCSAGMSRSPAIAAAGLACVHPEQSAEEWLTRVVHTHPSDVSPGLWADVTSCLQKPVSLSQPRS
jgi:hypothetical protein